MRELTPEAQGLVEEYYDSINVIARDDVSAMRKLVEEPRSGLWVIFLEGVPAGCVVLKAGIPNQTAGEVKRLYVRPAYRRKGMAEALMEALEAFARVGGMAWVYLDTNDAFRASVALYERRGYLACARYNDNPQATLFFRKRL
jgi:GNAT superfamily N-acetyltransferase